VGRFIASDEKGTDLIRKIAAIVEEQQSLHSTSLTAYSELLNQFAVSALDLLNYTDSRDTSRQKIAGLLVFDCLLDVTDDVKPERRFEVANHLLKILENDKPSLSTNDAVLRTAALAVGHFVRIASRTETDHFGGKAFQLAQNLIGNSRSETTRFAGALILSQLSGNAPSFIFFRRQPLFKILWELVADKSVKVRDAAAEALEAGLQVISQRETMVEYLQEALTQIHAGFAANTLEKNLSSLIILDIVVSGVVGQADLQTAIIGKDLADGLIWKVLQRRDSKDEAVRTKVIEIIPNIAYAFPSSFVHQNSYTSSETFLNYCLKYLMTAIQANRNRAVAFSALGKLCYNMSNQLRTSLLMEDIVLVIYSGFGKPFCVEALQCLGSVVSSCVNVRRLVDDEIVDSTFRGGLTLNLVDCLKILMKNVPSIRLNAQSQLRKHISNKLQKYTVLIDEVRGKSNAQLRLAKVKGRSSVAPSARESVSVSVSRRWGSGGSIFGSSAAKLLQQQEQARILLQQQQQEQLDTMVVNGVEWKPEEELIFALNLLTLSEFFPKMQRDRGGVNTGVPEDDQSVALLGIVHRAVVVYLDDCDPGVRIAAAVACAAVLDSSVLAVDPALEEFQVILQILDRLLIMGVGDDSEAIRVRVFDSLTPSLDHVISFTENMHCLLEALNDESLDVRIAAMNVISRVAHFDTLHVMPVMRLTMKRLILTLINSKDSVVKRESVYMLQALINGSHSLIVPYVRQVIEPLMSLLNSSSVDVVAALAAIGDLAVASPESVREHLHELSPKLIEALNDQSSVSKQETAVIAMGKLVSSLTIEVAEEPYKKYAGLFEGLVRAIQSKDDSSSELRLQAIKTVGLLGIVDTVAYQRHLQNSSNSQGDVVGPPERSTELKDEESDDEADEGGAAGEVKLSSVQKSYFTVVVHELMKILRDSSLPQYHLAAASAVIRVLRIIGPKAAQAPAQIQEIISGLLHRIYSSETAANLRETLLDHFITVISVVRRAIQSHLDGVIKLVQDMLEVHLQTCLNIIEALSLTISTPHFYLVLRGCLPALICAIGDESLFDPGAEDDSPPITTIKLRSNSNASVASNASSSAGVSVGGGGDRGRNTSNPFSRTCKILRTLNSIAGQLGEYRRDIISVVLKLLDCNAPVEVRRDALCTVMHLTNDADSLEFASRIVHPLLRLVDKMEVEMQTVIVSALSCLVCRLGRGFLPYIIPVRRRIRFIALRDGGKANKLVEEYESLVNRLLKQRPLPPEPSEIMDILPQMDKSIRRRCNNSKNFSDAVSDFDLASLETAWTLVDRRKTASDLTDWMNRLSIELIRQAPSALIRSCSPLATAYRPLAQGLFYSAFHCIWEELFASSYNELGEDMPLISGLETALQSRHSSKKAIVIPLLRLAEFMDMQDRHLSIDVRLLAVQAKNANMFAKCLYNRELEFASKNLPPSIECIDSLISVNNQLGLPDSAVGMLQHLKTHFPHIAIQSAWLEKLRRWNDAQHSYEEESLRFYEDFDQISGAEGRTFVARNESWMTSSLGKMRCLRALGEYEQLEESARQLREKIKATEDVDVDGYNPWSYLEEVQRLGANASWMLGKWAVMEDFLEDEYDEEEAMDVVLDQNVSFYRAILAIHKRDYDRADDLIEDTRSKLAGGIGALLSEKYPRAYRAMVTMQMLAEMEEVVDYKRVVDKALMDMEAVKNSSAEISSLLGDSPSRSATPTRRPEASAETLAPGIVDISAKKFNLILKWRGRLESAPPDIDSYRQILAVHTLVTEPTEDLDSWLELVTLCRKERMHSLCENILRKLGAPLPQRKTSDMGDMGIELEVPKEAVLGQGDQGDVTNDRVMLSTFEYWWSIGEKRRALDELSGYLRVRGVPDRLSSHTRRYSTHEATMFRVECLLKRADWVRELNEGGDGDMREIFAPLVEARDLAGDRYSVWHAWAVANYDHLKKTNAPNSQPPKDPQGIPGVVEFAVPSFAVPFEVQGTPRKGYAPKSKRKLASSSGSASLLNILSSQQVDSVTTYIVEAIRGFVKSIVLGDGQPVADVLQDTLRLITLWFSYGTKKGVFHMLEMELEKISPDNWLAVVPQLIARIHIKSPEISGMLRKLLSKVATAHPQALVCPISVALNTSDVQQSRVSTEVLYEMRKSRSRLVEEATMVSRELMRVAITPHELWYDGLEQAAQLYMDPKDVRGMMCVLMELHEAMDEVAPSVDESKPFEGFAEGIGKIGRTTLRDISFRHCYSKPLDDARQWLRKFHTSNRSTDLHQAWEIYQAIFKRVKVQISALKKLELHHVSPALTSAVDLSLAVPGTYKPGTHDIGIKSFSHFIGVIASKQRPRRMSMLGSDGKRYEFLLKGHEDLRQDERVMQLFGLINACLNNDNITNNRGLEIVRYSVLPLSNNSGVIGWVQNCDTLNQLVKQYRESKDMRLLIEAKLLHSKCLNYDRLPLLHKVDLFRQVMEETSGRDLAMMLWLKSKTSDVWVERRANFTKSMAVMSMAGYILGLGDRHPSNLMLDRITGRVVHIDFGDCFEITKQRSKYPEIIPFRLTRMLTSCMGPAGIQGSYRLTCERVMSVLRENRDSVMAMLEAFVYDPLISWRLLTNRDTTDTALPVTPTGIRSRASSDGEAGLPTSMEQLRQELTEGVVGVGSMKNTSTAQSLLLRNQSMKQNFAPTAPLLDMPPDLRFSRPALLAEDVDDSGEPLQENLNARALEVINRIQAKLTGRDFATNDDADDLTVEEQVERLIMEATSVENLCQLFTGWCPLW